MCCNRKNAQNLPRGNTSPIKKFVKPLKDYIVNIDLSQIEWRIAADLSGDKTMIDELWHGLDIHTDNATKFFGAGKYEKTSDEFKSLRTTAKVLGFRLLTIRGVHMATYEMNCVNSWNLSSIDWRQS